MHEHAPLAVTLLAILAGILSHRNDAKDLRAEIKSESAQLRSEMNAFRTETNARLK